MFIESLNKTFERRELQSFFKYELLERSKSISKNSQLQIFALFMFFFYYKKAHETFTIKKYETRNIDSFHEIVRQRLKSLPLFNQEAFAKLSQE